MFVYNDIYVENSELRTSLQTTYNCLSVRPEDYDNIKQIL